MNKSQERERLKNISGRYNSEQLAGANEMYHLFVRDALIPTDGGETALELSCGKGLWTKVLCERYDRVDIVDGAADLIDNCLRDNAGCHAEMTGHVELIEDFVQSTDRQWQHIYLTFLLEHVTDPVAVLRDVKNCLADDGRLFIAMPNAKSVHRVIALRMGLIGSIDELSENDISVGHRRIYTADLLRSQLIEAGYEIKKERSVGLKPLSLGQMKDWSMELVQAFCESGDIVSQHGAYIAIEAS